MYEVRFALSVAAALWPQLLRDINAALVAPPGPEPVRFDHALSAMTDAELEFAVSRYWCAPDGFSAGLSDGAVRRAACSVGFSARAARRRRSARRSCGACVPPRRRERARGATTARPSCARLLTATAQSS